MATPYRTREKQRQIRRATECITRARDARATRPYFCLAACTARMELAMFVYGCAQRGVAR